MSGNDLFAGLLRLGSAMSLVDSRSLSILAYHTAIERELDRALSRSLPHAGRLHGLGFGQKVGVWAASSKLKDEFVHEVVNPLRRLNDLRNSVAHADDASAITKALERLISACKLESPPVASLDAAAAYLFGRLNADGLAQELAAAALRVGARAGQSPSG